MIWKRCDWKIFLLLLLIAAGIIIINGTTTEVNLGDESHHYRFAQNIYNTGKRVAFDPLYESGNPPGFFYNSPPLWHFGLAFLWKITGGQSQTVAQIYHTLFFILLVLLTSALAKETVGGEGRWFPALIIITVPMVVSFSTLFYMDIPMTALATLSFYFVLKRRYIEAGVASGLAYFTKLNAGFFFPGFLFLIFWNERKKFWPLWRDLTFFILPTLIIYLIDANWRKLNISGQVDTIGLATVGHRISVVVTGIKLREYLTSYLTNPVDIVKYFGFVFLFLLFSHLFQFKRWNKKENIYWVPVISYFVFLLLFFGIVTDTRYIIPIVPFMVAMISQSLVSIEKRWRFIIIMVCLFQFATTSVYVHQKRKISPEIKEGFEYIRKNIPEKALILYPEENLLVYGHRRIIWNAFRGFQSGKTGLGSLFWAKDDEEMNHVLKDNRVDHILIKKSRIYDDRKQHHFGGYPQSFIEKLSNIKGWVKIFENHKLELWKKIEKKDLE